MFHLCGRKIQLFCRIKVQPAIWHGNSDKDTSSIDLIFCSMFRCTTQILTRCRGQCASTWSTRRGPLSMTSQISLSLSCHRYWMNSGQVWVYLVQVWMQCVSSLSLQSLAKLVKHHKLIVMSMVPMAAKKTQQASSQNLFVMRVHVLKAY